ncbi:MAG: hypothetical protein ACLQUY_01060 [Ktedonobacterales bacterium]
MLAEVALRHLSSHASTGPQNIQLIPQDGGFFDLLFHKTAISIEIFGQPKPPFSLNLIQFVIILILAFIITEATERLTGRKVSLPLAIVVTLIGSWLFSNYVNLPFDFAVENVRIVAALLGALIIAVFYTLILGKAKK